MRSHLRTLLADHGTVLTALRLFDDQDKPETASFGSGEFSGTILDTLRRAGAPMCARDIAEALGGGTDARRPGVQGFAPRVRNELSRLSDRLEGVLRDRTTYWRDHES